MNNKFSLLQRLLVIIVLLNILGGCALVHETKGGGSENMETFHTYSYRDLQKMDEITIDSENVFFVLQEDQALPYRWNYELEGEGVCVSRDYAVDEPRMNLPNLAVGSSPAFHVFEVKCETDGKGTFRLVSRHLYSDDINGEKFYSITNVSGVVTVKMEDNGNILW